jgi:hypothetical protein
VNLLWAAQKLAPLGALRAQIPARLGTVSGPLGMSIAIQNESFRGAGEEGVGKQSSAEL